NAIEQVGGVAGLDERFDPIAVRQALCLDHFRDFLFQLVGRLWLRTFDQENAEIRGGGRARPRAAVPVRSREVAKRLPAEEVSGEYAAVDDGDGRRLYTCAVNQVAPDETRGLKRR